MKKLFKVTDNKSNLDITEDCFMDSDGNISLFQASYDWHEFVTLEHETFQKDHIQYPRYTVEKFI